MERVMSIVDLQGGPDQLVVRRRAENRRSRAQAALGFKVLTPASDRSSLLVVEGSGLSADRNHAISRRVALRPDAIETAVVRSGSKGRSAASTSDGA